MKDYPNRYFVLLYKPDYVRLETREEMVDRLVEDAKQKCADDVAFTLSHLEQMTFKEQVADVN